MCYSTRQTKKRTELERQVRLQPIIDAIDIPAELELIYFHANGWNHPIMWSICQEHPNHLLPNMWGIMPHNKQQQNFKEHFKNPKTRGGLNARSESLFDHFIYRNCWKKQRCVIPVDGFFEPHNTKVKVKGRDFKVPFYFKRTDGDSLFLAGIYTNTADNRRTFAILTKDATPLFEKIHNDQKRRPVIIAEENIDEWLYDGMDEADIENLLENDVWDDELTAHPVSKEVYAPTVDSNYPEIIKKVDYETISIDF